MTLLARDEAVEPYRPRLSAEAQALLRVQGELAEARRRLAEVELLADRDPLAPVLNRRAFVRELGRMIAYCARYGGEAALVYFDLDGFKAVNDLYGHAAGDQLLKVVAATLSAHVRESDVVGRLGGDEFAVALAQAGAEAAKLKAASLAAEIGKAAAVVEGRLVRVSASFGVRAWEPGLDAARMMAEADAAMFLEKGRRRRGGATP